MLHSISDGIPDVEIVITIDNNNLNDGQVRLGDARRKTASPLNIEIERRDAWKNWLNILFFLVVKMNLESSDKFRNTLDYFQARITDSDRFKRTDYLVDPTEWWKPYRYSP